MICNDYEVKISDNNKSKTKVHFAVKVLSSLGIQHAVFEEHINPARKIKSLEGWKINDQGEEEKLDDDYIFTFDPKQSVGYYDDAHLYMASFPDVEAGDIIAYEYEIRKDEYWNSYKHTFLIQNELPVLESNISMEIPKSWTIMESLFNLKSIHKQNDESKYYWQIGFLPYRPDEPYMPPKTETMRLMNIGCYDPEDPGSHTFTDWPAISRWTHDIFIKPTYSDTTISRIVNELQTSSSTPQQLIEAIAEYVRDKIRYVAIEIGEGRFVPRISSATALNNYGDCKDKSALMIALLKEAGFEACPVLTSLGYTIDPDFYTPFQFNHCIVAIKKDSLNNIPEPSYVSVGEWFFYDPTDPSTSLGELPEGLYGTWVLPGSDPGSELVTLPEIPSDQLYRKYFANATLNSDNSIIADIIITISGLESSQFEYFMKNKTNQEHIKKYQESHSNSVNNPRISDFKIDYFEDSCQVHFTLQGDNYTTTSGNMRMMTIDLFHNRLSTEKFKDKRIHPITFGAPALVEWEILWNLPEEWEFEIISDTTIEECSIASFQSYKNSTNSTIVFKCITEYKGGEIPVSAYKKGYDFIRKLNSSLNAVAVITEK